MCEHVFSEPLCEIPPCWINQCSWGCNCHAGVKAVSADNEHGERRLPESSARQTRSLYTMNVCMFLKKKIWLKKWQNPFFFIWTYFFRGSKSEQREAKYSGSYYDVHFVFRREAFALRALCVSLISRWFDYCCPLVMEKFISPLFVVFSGRNGST